eukprot:COSAG01_NODE_46134_length_402_cov_16.613861_1_plen_53_part_10
MLATRAAKTWPANPEPTQLADLADGPWYIRPDAIRGRGEDQVPLPPPQQIHTH